MLMTDAHATEYEYFRQWQEEEDRAIEGMMEDWRKRFPHLSVKGLRYLVNEEIWGPGPPVIFTCPCGHGEQPVHVTYYGSDNSYDFEPEDNLYCHVCDAEMEEL